MFISFIGLGGGGTRVAKEFYRWLSLERSQSDTDGSRGAWTFQTTAQKSTGEQFIDNAVGFVMLDSYSGEIFRDAAPLPLNVGYKLADEEGFGGDRKRATASIERVQAALAEYRLPGPHISLERQPTVPLLTGFLQDTMGVGSSDIVVPCVSLVGGTGRGAYDYLSGFWPQIFAPLTPNILITVIPPLAELQNVRLAKEAKAYISVLRRSLNRGPRNAVVLVTYDLAQALFASCGQPDLLEKMHLQRTSLQQAVRTRNRSQVVAALDELGKMDVRELPPGQFAVDGGILTAMLPLFSNCFGAMSRDSFGIHEPKGLDPNDIGGLFSGHFVVPCYMEALAPLDVIQGQIARDLGIYHALGVQNPNALTWLTDLALNSGSMLPIAGDRAGLGRTAASVLAIVWSRDPSFSVGQLSGVSQFLRRTLNVPEPIVSVLRGEDPVAKYIVQSKGNTSLADVHARIWLYVLLRNERPATDLIDLSSR